MYLIFTISLFPLSSTQLYLLELSLCLQIPYYRFHCLELATNNKLARNFHLKEKLVVSLYF